MNFRNTTFMFGLLLGMLWIFGLMLAFKRTASPEGYLLPTFHDALGAKIDTVVIERPGAKPEKFQFSQADDLWTLRIGDKSTRVEGFRVQQLITALKDAKATEGAPLKSDLAFHGLDKPLMTITVSGDVVREKKEKIKTKGKDKDKEPETKTVEEKVRREEWKLFLGKDSADKAFVYANSSDRPGKPFAVERSSLRGLFFDDPNTFRSRLLFTFDEPSARELILREGKTEVAFKKTDDAWRFVQPPLGYVDYEGPPIPKDLPPGIKIPEGGLKGLLTSLRGIRVDTDEDFVPLDQGSLESMGLVDGQEALRLEVRYEETRGKKELANETLLVGKSAGKDQVYARLLSDPGAFKLNGSMLEAVQRALKDPSELRNRDLVNFDVKAADQIVLKARGGEVKLVRPALKPWEVQGADGKGSKANEKLLQTYLEALQGKRAIKDFAGGKDFKGAVEVRLYQDSLKEPAAPTDEKKDDKKDGKKEEKKDDKKEIKPVVTLAFAAAEKDQKLVAVQRTLADGTVSHFQVDAALVSQISPARPALAFLDLQLPEFTPSEVARFELTRGGAKIDVVKGTGADAQRWYVEDPREPSGKLLADPVKVATLLNNLGGLRPLKWIAREKEADLDKFGLKTPAVVARVMVKKDKLSAGQAATMLGVASAPSPVASLFAGMSLHAAKLADQGEEVLLKFGKEAKAEDDGPGVYALNSGKDLVFLVTDDQLKYLREIDLKDRSAFLTTQVLVDAGLVGAATPNAINVLMLASPLNSGRLQHFDPAAVQSISVALRTPLELRSFVFQKDAKSKEWNDQTGLKEFAIDASRVTTFLEQLAQLRADRLASLAPATAEQKLTAKDATLKIDLTLADGQTIAVTFGATYERGGVYAQTSAWPGVTFLVSPLKIDPWLRGVGYFGKERVSP